MMTYGNYLNQLRINVEKEFKKNDGTPSCSLKIHSIIWNTCEPLVRVIHLETGLEVSYSLKSIIVKVPSLQKALIYELSTRWDRPPSVTWRHLIKYNDTWDVDWEQEDIPHMSIDDHLTQTEVEALYASWH